jgi:RNA polymerase sigma-70 factor (ECF subfamily)
MCALAQLATLMSLAGNFFASLGFTLGMTAANVLQPVSFLPMLDSQSMPKNLPLISVEDSVDAESVRLMLRVKEGDERAFERLVEIHHHAVIGTVTRMLGNAEDAHDVAQQLFVRIWKSAPRYEPSAKFTTWMYTITRNLVLNEVRKRQRRREVSMNEPTHEDQVRELQDVETATADISAQRSELEAALDNAIAALPEKSRMAVILRRYEETPYEELCKILGMTLPAVKSLLFRARTEMRKHLEQYLDLSD